MTNVRTDWWTKEGGAADVLAAVHDTVMDGVAPEMMKLTTGPLGRAQEVALFASPRSRGTTGADFVVDAGRLKEV